MTQLLVYRFEDAAGIGLYQTPNRRIQRARRSYDWPHHPTPEEDKFPSVVLNRLHTDPRYWLFGFISANQLMHWFDKDDVMQRLFDAGAVVGVYRCRWIDVHVREHQLVFRRERAIRCYEIIDRASLIDWRDD